MTDIETEVKPQYDRGNLADVFDHIEKDLAVGLPSSTTISIRSLPNTISP